MDINILKKLCTAFGVSGDEKEISLVVSDIMSDLCEKIEYDSFGNIYCYKSFDESFPTVMLDAHMDSVGLIVKKIYERGFLKFETVGGIDSKILPGLEVLINAKEKIKGVITSKPPHLMNNDDVDKIPVVDELFIDTGYINKDISKVVSPGNLISFSPFCEKMGNSVTGTDLDNRIGCMAVIDIFSKFKDVKLPFNLVAVFSRQEEIGLCGASNLKIKPDFCITIDVTHGQTPDEKGDEAFACGKGIAIATGPNISRKYFDRIINICDLEQIDYQVEVLEASSGTNAWKYQLLHEGIPCLILSVPLKFMHTSVETVSESDYENIILILEKFLKALTADFIIKNSEFIKIK